MKAKIILQAIILACIFGLSGSVRPSNNSNLAGTYSLLPKQLRDVSPLNGAAVWQKQIIQNLYDDGHLTPGEPTNTIDLGFNEKLSKWLGSIPSSSIQRVVRVLFNRPPGTQGQADFRPSKTITENPQELTQKIAYNLAQLFLYQMLEPELDGKNSEQRKQRLATALECKKIGKVSSNDFYLAYHDEIYPGNQIITYTLLALLWVIANNDRQLLKLYFTTLHDALLQGIKKLEKLTNPKTAKKTPIPALGLPTTKEQEAASVKFSTALKKIQKIVKDFNPELFDIEKQFTQMDLADLEGKPVSEIITTPELNELLVYKLLNSKSLPPMLLSTKDLSFSIDENHEVRNLRPCFEVAIHNLMNIFAFNPKTQKYSTKRLEKNLGYTVHPDLTAFYEKYPDPEQANTLDAQNAWAKLLSNQDNISYMVTTEEQFDAKTPYEELYKSYPIRITDPVSKSTKIALKKLKLYIPKDSTLTHYDLQGTFRNFILILDHLLQLDLFAYKYLGDTLIKENFTEKYLSKILRALGAGRSSGFCYYPETNKDLGFLKISLPKFQADAQFTFTRKHVDLTIEEQSATPKNYLDTLKKKELDQHPILHLFISFDKYANLEYQDTRPLIPYFAHYKSNPQNHLLAHIVEKPLSEGWVRLIEYLQKQYGFVFDKLHEERLIIGALEKNLKNAQKKAENFLTNHQDPEKNYFPEELWGHLVITNPVTFASPALKEAKNKLEDSEFRNKDAVCSFLLHTSLHKENTISGKALNLIKELIINQADLYNKSFYMGLQKILANKKTTIQQLEPLLNHLIAQNAPDSFVVGLCTTLETVLEDNNTIIHYQDLLPYIKIIGSRNPNPYVAFQQLALLEKCYEKGMPAQEVAEYLQYITFNKKLTTQMIVIETTSKYTNLIYRLLENESDLQTNKHFLDMVKKHTLNNMVDDYIKLLKPKTITKN